MMLIECKPDSEQDSITIEQAELAIASGNGIIVGFPVHDGKTVFCEFLEFTDVTK